MNGKKQSSTNQGNAAADQLDGNVSDDDGRKDDKDSKAFDRWLKTRLTELYGPVLEEPIPEEFLKVIEDEYRKKKNDKE